MRFLKYCDYSFNYLCGSVLIILFSLSINHVSGKECKSIDVRNSVKYLNQIRNCTVIKGHLHIVLIERDNATLWEKYSFPELREITGYVLIYRLYYIRTFANLFPNLAVIRGNILFKNYALIIRELYDLSEVGLYSLISVQRGKVSITEVPSLCYLHTIDWTRIVKTPGVNMFEKHVKPSCPTNISCEACPHHNCWEKDHCQKYENENLVDPTITNCHPQCLGGCYNETLEGCYICRGPVNDETCVEKCPEHKFLVEETNRCVTKDECIALRQLPHEGGCLRHCPSGWSTKNFETGEYSDTECFKCLIDCPRICDSTEITYLSDVQHMKGCTVINGTLKIKLSPDVTMQDLEDNLGDIEEIRGYLKIYDSMNIHSMRFFKKLLIIHGHELAYDKYAIVIYENYNLQALYNDYNREPLQILRGSMFFQLNHKLCPSEIELFENHTRYDKSMDFTLHYTSFDVLCQPIEQLETRHRVRSPHEATIFWTIPNVPEHLVEFLLLWLETSSKNVTPYTGHDVCFANIWKSKLVGLESIEKVGKYWSYNITELKPFTQYAYYLKTYKILDKSIVNAETNVDYFETDSKVPPSPLVSTMARTTNSITLQWYPSKEYNDRVSYFQIDVFIQPEKKSILDTRDYCMSPLQPTTTTTPKPIDPSDCCTKYSAQGTQYIDKYKLECIKQECPELTHLNSFERRIRALDEGVAIDMRNREAINYEFFMGSHTISGKATDITINNLSHYTLYTFHVYACDRKLGLCGSYTMHSERTARLVEADDLELEVALDYYKPTDVHAIFKEPEKPNGMTVSYILFWERHAPENFERGHVCITRLEHERRNYIYTFPKLLKNTAYQFRVQSVSIAGHGQYTPWKFIFVYDPRDNLPLRIVIFFLFVGFFGGAGLGYWIYKKYKGRRQQTDEVILLSTFSSNTEGTGQS